MRILDSLLPQASARHRGMVIHPNTGCISTLNGARSLRTRICLRFEPRGPSQILDIHRWPRRLVATQRRRSGQNDVLVGARQVVRQRLLQLLAMVESGDAPQSRLDALRGAKRQRPEEIAAEHRLTVGGTEFIWKTRVEFPVDETDLDMYAERIMGRLSAAWRDLGPIVGKVTQEQSQGV